jgi:hypothetical protein
MAYTGAWKTDVVRLRAFEPGEDAGGKERGGRAMHGARPAARKLMQGPEDEPALRQAGIDFLDAKRQDGKRRTGALLEMRDPGAQIVQNSFLPRVQHGFSELWGPFVPIMFSFCGKSQ